MHRTPGMGPEHGTALLFSRGDGGTHTQCGELQESLKESGRRAGMDGCTSLQIDGLQVACRIQELLPLLVM